MRISDWSSDVCTSDLMMLSESQERMLMVLQPGKEDLARGIFEKWDLDFAIIGRLTDSGRMVLKMRGAVVGDLPIRSEEHTSELQSLMRISYAVFCLKKKKQYHKTIH